VGSLISASDHSFYLCGFIGVSSENDANDPNESEDLSTFPSLWDSVRAEFT